MFRRVIATFAALVTAATFAATAQAAEPSLSEGAVQAQAPTIIVLQNFNAFGGMSNDDVKIIRLFPGDVETVVGNANWPDRYVGPETRTRISLTYREGTLSTEVGEGDAKTTTTRTISLGPLNFIQITLSDHNTAGSVGLDEINLDGGSNLGYVVQDEGVESWKITGKDLTQGFSLGGELVLKGTLEGAFSRVIFAIGYLPPTDSQGPVTKDVDVQPKVAVLKGAIDLKAEMSDPSNIAYAQFCTRPKLDQQRCFDSGWEMIGAADGAFGGSFEAVQAKLFKAADTVGLHDVCVRGVDTLGNVGEAACQSYAVAYKFDGFFQPISNVQVNSPRAGRAFPVKWRLTDANGQPIDDPDSIKVVTYPVNCSNFTGDPNAVEETVAAGNSGLQSLGNGYWQYNWKTENADAGTCHRLLVQLKDGVGLPSARFKFRQ